MGKFWDGCAPEDMDKLYPCKIVDYNDKKKVPGIAALQQMVGVEMLDEAAEYNPEVGLIWVSLAPFSEYHLAHIASAALGALASLTDSF